MKINRSSNIKNSHINKYSNKNLKVILNNGIGDIIYSWYKLINLVNMGYGIHVCVGNQEPQRSHQIMGCLDGMIGFEYVSGLDYYKYWLKNVDDPRTPPEDSLFNNIPVLYLNSFLETNKHMDIFMKNFPIVYDINISTNDDAIKIANSRIDINKFSVILYCSNYQNNINCNMFPDPNFWANLVEFCCSMSDKTPYIFIIGATYDMDLSKDVHEAIKSKNIDCNLYINNSLYSIIEILRRSNLVITYESGWGMISDALKVPCLEIFRCQGGDRDDKSFPFLGPINPEGIGKRFFPFFYDDDIDSIKNKIKEMSFHEKIYNI